MYFILCVLVCMYVCNVALNGLTVSYDHKDDFDFEKSQVV